VTYPQVRVPDEWSANRNLAASVNAGGPSSDLRVILADLPGFGIEVLNARAGCLRILRAFLMDYLGNAAPVHGPSSTAFVRAPKDR